MAKKAAPSFQCASCGRLIQSANKHVLANGSVFHDLDPCLGVEAHAALFPDCRRYSHSVKDHPHQRGTRAGTAGRLGLWTP